MSRSPFPEPFAPSALLILLALSFLGCAPASEPAAPSSEAPGPAPLKLYVFDCGRLQFENFSAFGIADDETDVREMAVPCYVIEHAAGRLLFEGGLPSELAQEEGWREMDGGWRMRLDRPLADQLSEIDLSMSDFDFIAFSHFHFDHVGAANEVVGATWLARRSQVDTAFAEEVTVPGFTPELYSQLNEGAKIVYEEDHDVFGDGRVLLLAAPGHTPGHQVLFVDLAATGPVVLSGDLYVLRLAHEQQRVLPLDMLPEQSQSSMDRIEALLREKGAELWIGHEAALFDQQRRPPAYYD